MRRKKAAIIGSFILTASLLLTSCAPAPNRSESPPPDSPQRQAVNLPKEGALTTGQITNYLIQAALGYNTADRATMLSGMEDSEDAKATRMQALVLISRAFGALPAPEGNNAHNASPAPDLTDVPEWAKADLENLSKGGVLTAADLGQADAIAAAQDGVATNGPIADGPVADGPAADTPETNAPDTDDTSTPDEVDFTVLNHLVRRIWTLYGSNLKDDFYSTINKVKLSNTQIPATSNSAGVVSQMQSNINERLKSIVMEIVDSQENYSQGSAEQRIRDFYNNILDEEARNTQGIQPIQKYLDAIDAATTAKELTQVLANVVKELGKNNTGLFHYYLDTDLKDKTKNIISLLPYESGMFVHEYANPQGEDYQRKRSKLIEVLVLAGESKADAQTHVDAILSMAEKIDNVLEEAYLSGKYDNLNNLYNFYTAAELEQLLPELGLTDFFTAIGFHSDIGYSFGGPDGQAIYNEYLNNANLPMLKAIAKIGLLGNNSKLLGKELSDIYDDFYGSDTAQKKSLEEQALETVSGYMSTELSKLYVGRYFSEEAKQKAEALAQSLVEAYKQRIHALDWMSQETKKEAIRKLDSLNILIGYPDAWEPNTAEILSGADGGSYFQNISSVEQQRLAEDLKMQYETKGASTFAGMPPINVNAAANRVTNTILIPAGILQAPLFDVNASDEENLSGIGTIIGHEISHVFDDQGAQYDSEGNLRDWWTPADYKSFQERCSAAVSFYDGHEAAPGIFADGKATLSENIADIAGMAVTLQVLSNTENPDYELFFQNYAESWVKVSTRQGTEGAANGDVHAPYNLRVNRVVVNFQEFFDAFGINQGDGMYVAPADRIKIW